MYVIRVLSQIVTEEEYRKCNDLGKSGTELSWPVSALLGTGLFLFAYLKTLGFFAVLLQVYMPLEQRSIENFSAYSYSSLSHLGIG